LSFFKVLGCCLLVLFGVTQQAVARPVEDVPFPDDQDERPVLVNRARPFDLTFETSLMFATSVVEKYTSHLGGVLALDLHFNNVIAIEGLGGYFAMNESSIISGPQGVRFFLNGAEEPPLPDLVGMSWVAFGNLSVAPIYGKINFLSEAEFNSQIYLVAGAGAVGAVRRTLSSNLPCSSSSDACLTTQVASVGTKFAIDAGVGFRLFLWRWLALKAEFLDIIYTDSFDYYGNGAKETDYIQNYMGLFGVSIILH
jgi:outer membrane beta-barrel protein